MNGKNYTSLQAAIDEAQDGETVKLLADAAEDVAISKSITLDLGGKTLTNTNSSKATVSVQGGTVTVKNGNVVGGTGYYNIEVTKGGNANLTLADVTATAGNTGSSMIDNWGTLAITSGSYTGGLNVVKSEEGSALIISGGTFTRTTAPRWGTTGTVLVYGTTTITGGTFNEKSASTNARVVVTGRVDGYGSVTYIKGGTFNGNGNNVFHHLNPAQADDSFKVSGGTFNKSIPDYYCADGFIPKSNGNGTYGVKEGHYAAQIGSKKYETLADAIRLAAKGKTITLLADVEQNTQLTINKNITLDLNGKTIKNTQDIWGEKTNAILSITNGAKVTITGNGTMDAKENDCYTINVVKGDLIIENGTFYGNVSVVQVQEGTLSVKGGTFDLHQKWEGSSKYLFNCIDDAYVDGGANVAISGGTFVGFDPNVSPERKAGGKSPSFAAPGAGVTRNEDGSFTATAGKTAQILDKDGNSVKACDTLEEAIDAAQDGDTVKLLADATEDVTVAEGKNLTLDLNGFTLANAKGHTITNNGALTIKDSSEAKTGTVDNLTNGKAPVENNQGATCTIAGGIFTRSKETGKTPENSGGNSYYYIENFGTMTIGGDVKVSSEGHFSSLVHNGWYDGSKNTAKTNAVMTIDSGSFAGGINTIKNDDYGEITINGGDFKNATQHPLFNVNVATVNGGTFESSTNSAVYTKAYDNAGDKGTTTIKGGTFKSASGKSDFLVNNDTYKSTVVVSGGTFSAEVSADCCAKDFVCVKNSDGTYGVAQQGVVVEPSEENKNSGSVATNGVTVKKDEQKKVAESAAKAAASVKDTTVDETKNEAKIGDMTVDTRGEGKAEEVKKVAEEAKKQDASVSVKLVVKADQNVTANKQITDTAANATVVPFELSVDMVTEVTAADGTTTTATVPVKETGEPITVTIRVSPQSIAGKTVMVARVHDDKLKLIEPSKVDPGTGDITFKTDRFSDYAVVASETNQSYELEDYTEADGSRKTINNADFNVSDDYAFAGWYKDADLTQPCASTDTNGTVYPKFVKIGDYIKYMGGSLRMDGPQASESTSLRFGYITSVPDGAKYIDSWWTWNDGANDRTPVKANKRVLFENGSALANLVLTGVPSNSYSTTVHVTEHLTYQTVDGTTVEVAEVSSHQHSVVTVAQAILGNPGASSSERNYAQQILATIK